MISCGSTSQEECQPTHGVRVSGGADICMDGSKRDEIIHTFSVLHGASAVYQAVTLLKSILYSQGQFKDHLPECLTGWIRHKDINCVHHSPSPRQYLNMHWVVDQGSRGFLVDLVRGWNQSHILQIILYPYENYLKLIGHARTKHYAGYSAMMKLMAPYIVDSNVQKVIVLDVDLLFNDDIKELWKYFSQFQPGEAIGAVCEQSGECQASCSSPAVPGLVNKVLWNRTYMYHHLPCEWNVQVHTDSEAGCCPVYWHEAKTSKVNCRQTSSKPQWINSARIVHFNIKNKPEDKAINHSDSEDFGSGLKPLTILQLRSQFARVYYSFRRLPSYCFF
ncbi:LARGE xylosyl- and glucuronyltransferase 1, variant 2 [Clonorchis sinensis]|uniref:LARGE xylosyl- and glucuronyltransferase 1, variant 2 n=1 Tax=Clonorchis sinensis TaxID=79923 RepID=A0A8T1N0M7_CLOSI|nr:LARGE xylosyl- and glucuronyltransferase 1, variant 2 [Clonorchis sinensis]